MKAKQLPQGWKEVELREISASRKERGIAGEESYIEIGDIDIATKKYDLKDKKSIEGCNLAYKGDVIISRVRPTRGAISIILKNKIEVSSAFTILIPKKEILPGYLFYFLAYNKSFFDHLGRMQKGSSYPSCREKDILDFKIIYPESKEVQKQIVSILEKAETLKQKREESDKLTKEYLQSVFYEMFLNKRFEEEELSKLVNRLTNGYVGPTRNIYHPTGVPYILSKHIDNNRIFFDNKTFITKEFNEKNKKSILKKGDILLIQTGEIGKSGVVEMNHQGHNCHALIVITPKEEKLNGWYLSFYFNSKIGFEQTRTIQTGATLKHLNCRDVEKLKIPLPPLPLQQKFARIVEQVEKLKEKQQKSKEEINNLFNSLMQKAFNGELVR